MLPPDTAGFNNSGVPTRWQIPRIEPGFPEIIRQGELDTPVLSNTFFIGIFEVVIV